VHCFGGQTNTVLTVQPCTPIGWSLCPFTVLYTLIRDRSLVKGPCTRGSHKMTIALIVTGFVLFFLSLGTIAYREQILKRVGAAASCASGVGDLTGSWLSRFWLNRIYVRVVHRGDQYQLELYSGFNVCQLGQPATRENAIAGAENIRKRIDQIIEALAVDNRIVWTDGRTLTNYPGP
jgi:hypothetical protein